MWIDKKINSKYAFEIVAETDCVCDRGLCFRFKIRTNPKHDHTPEIYLFMLVPLWKEKQFHFEIDIYNMFHAKNGP